MAPLNAYAPCGTQQIMYFRVGSKGSSNSAACVTPSKRSSIQPGQNSGHSGHAGSESGGERFR
jgi:hypothetical protein